MRSIRDFLPFLAAFGFTLIATLRANPDEFWQMSAGLPLFGWFRLFLAHDILAIPMAWVFAGFFRYQLDDSDPSSMRNGMTIACVLLLIFWPQTLSLCNQFCVGIDAGISLRAVCRGLFLAVVQAMILLAWRTPETWRTCPDRLAFAFSFLLAIVPPAIYAHRLEEIHGERVEFLLESGRFKTAKSLCFSLLQIGSQKQYANKSLPQLISGLDSQLADLEQYMNGSQNRFGPAPSSMELAYQYFQLDDFRTSVKILKESNKNDVQSQILLGTIYREQEQWGNMADLFSALIDQVPAELAPMCFESLAEALRNLDRPAEAEAIYRRAISELQYPASFHLKLGLLLADQARTSEAIEQLERAVAIKPKLAKQTELPLRDLKTSTWSCLTRTKPSSSK